MAVVAPLGSSDHSSLSIAILMAQVIPNLYVSRRVLLKNRVNWSAVCDAIGVLPWRSIWSADNPVERLNVHLSLLVEHFVPSKVICVRNKDKPWFNDDCNLAFDIKQGPISGGLVIALEITGMSLSITRGGPMLSVYAEAMHQFSVRSQDVLMNAQCPHKWWSTLKSALFGLSSDSSVPPLIGAGGGLVCESVGKADLLSAHFDGKQSRDPVDLPSETGRLAIRLPVSLPLRSGHRR